MAISSEALGVQGIEMDYETLTLFSLDEFTDLSHGMTGKSTKLKRTIERPTNHWGDTNQQTRHAERQSLSLVKNAIALQTSKTLTIKD